MAKDSFVKGTVSNSQWVFLQDSSKTDQSGLTGLVAPASNLVAPVNSAFSTASTGGTLAGNTTYYYRVTATNALGESLPSTETSQVVPAGTATNTVTVNWGSVANATGYKVYGRLQNGELLIATVGAVTTYVDTGSITPSGAITTLSAVGLTCYYIRQGANATVAIPLANAVLGTYQSGGFVAVDNTNMPGMYELGLPNAAIAAGAVKVAVMFKGATNLSPYPMEIKLQATDDQNAVNGGMGGIPNVAAGAAGGLPTATNASGQVVASSLVANQDKSGYALTSGEHTTIATDAQTGLTAQGYTTTRAGYMDVLNGLVAAIWAATTRTLTAFGFGVTASTVSDKTGYSLATSEHTAISGTDIPAALNAQGLTTVRAGKIDNLDAAVSTRATIAQILVNTGKPIANNATDGSVLRDLTQLLPTPRDMSTVADNAVTAADAEWAAVIEAHGQQDQPNANSWRKKTGVGTVTRTFATNPNNSAPTSRT